MVAAQEFLRTQGDDLGAPQFVDVKVRRAGGRHATQGLTSVLAQTGMRLRYMRWGASGPTVLLLHGLGDCAGVLSGLARRRGRSCLRSARTATLTRSHRAQPGGPRLLRVRV